jgi:putative flippase GtrA
MTATLHRKFVGYVLTGGCAAVVDLGGFQLLSSHGMPVLPAATLSWLVAAFVNYRLSARYVFARTPGGRNGMAFLAAAAVGLLINASVTTAGASLLQLPPVVAKTLGIGTAFFVNFLLNALVVFR